jgi:ubiquinone/menaquinone biosynthesis C-methylase UbiE
MDADNEGAVSGGAILKFTGERFVPGEAEGDIELEHLHRYSLACALAKGKRILDVASGEGYGSAMLAAHAAEVIGVDISEEAIRHASGKYTAPNLRFVHGSCSALPLPDAAVDMVVSFETIEHHDQHEAMMQEIKRVLRPGGLLVISCPDKLEYSDKPGYVNEFHVKELYRGEFQELLARHFARHRLYGQRVGYGSVVLSESYDGLQQIQSYAMEGNELRAYSGVPHAVYLIAVVSDGALPTLGVGVFDLPLASAPFVKATLAHSERLQRAVDELKGTVESLLVERDAYRQAVENLEAALRSGSAEHAPGIDGGGNNC